MIKYDPLLKTMKEKGISIPDILKKMGTRSGCLKMYLNSGKYISLDTIDKLCEILDCKVEDIIVYKKGPKVIREIKRHYLMDWEKLDDIISKMGYRSDDIGPMIGKSETWYNSAKKKDTAIISNINKLCSVLKLNINDFVKGEVK